MTDEPLPTFSIDTEENVAALLAELLDPEAAKRLLGMITGNQGRFQYIGPCHRVNRWNAAGVCVCCWGEEMTVALANASGVWFLVEQRKP
jgi:hypothetical protein